MHAECPAHLIFHLMAPKIAELHVSIVVTVTKI